MKELNLSDLLKKEHYKKMKKQKIFDILLLITLGTLQVIDFIFTWYGIHELNIIVEGNPFLVWTFEIPFKQAIILRLVAITVIIAALIVIRNNNRRNWLFVNSIGIMCNLAIVYMHYLWLLPYL